MGFRTTDALGPILASWGIAPLQPTVYLSPPPPLRWMRPLAPSCTLIVPRGGLRLPCVRLGAGELVWVPLV